MTKLHSSIVALFAATPGASLAADPIVGGAPMDPSKTIIENLDRSKDHTSLVTAIKEARLVELLFIAKPSLTVFAPTNAAFAPNDALDSMLVKERKKDLKQLLAYHIVAGGLHQ